jgi:hypothetical protein
LSETFVRLLPLALAGLFLPTWTLYVIALLGTDRPLADSSAFVLGNVVFRAGLGILVLFGVGAVVVTAVGVREFLNRDTPSGAAEAVLSRFRRMTPWVAFAFGFAAVAAPGVQYVYFLGGVSIIEEAGLDTAESLALLAAFVLLLQAMLVTPIVLYAILRTRARPALDSMEAWIVTRGRLVGSLILGALGVYLAFRALEYFWT